MNRNAIPGKNLDTGNGENDDNNNNTEIEHGLCACSER